MISQEMLQKFKLWLLKKNLSPKSIYAYQLDVQKFFFTFEINEYSEITKEKIDLFVLSGNISTSTSRRRSVSLRIFKNFLEENQIFISMDIPIIKEKENEIKIENEQLLSSEEIKKLLEEIPNEKFLELRNKAIFETLYSTGLRTSEIIEINATAVNMEFGFLSFHRNNREKIIPINKKNNLALYQYVIFCQSNITDWHQRKLFINKNYNPISRQTIWKIIKEYIYEKIGKKNVTPYILKKSFAKHLLESGASISTIYEIFGIKDISALLNNNDINDKYKDFYRYHPTKK